MAGELAQTPPAPWQLRSLTWAMAAKKSLHDWLEDVRAGLGVQAIVQVFLDQGLSDSSDLVDLVESDIETIISTVKVLSDTKKCDLLPELVLRKLKRTLLEGRAGAQAAAPLVTPLSRVQKPRSSREGETTGSSMDDQAMPDEDRASDQDYSAQDGSGESSDEDECDKDECAPLCPPSHWPSHSPDLPPSVPPVTAGPLMHTCT